MVGLEKKYYVYSFMLGEGENIKIEDDLCLFIKYIGYSFCFKFIILYW